MIRRIGAAVLMLLLVAGLSCAVDMNPDKYVLPHTHSFKQDVSGEGYVMVYQNVNTNNLSLKNYMHGSGAMNMATLIYSEQKVLRTIDLIPANGVIYTYKAGEDSSINFTEQNEMTYAPEVFTYGTGWYATHPIRYESLLKEKTDGRNFQAGISMDHQIEYARAFKKDIAVQLNCSGPTIADWVTSDGKGFGQMRIDDDVTAGTVHIGELLTRPDHTPGGLPQLGGIGAPLILIDENYIGNFKIQKEMKINVPKVKPSISEDWLPCCSGGFFDMYAWDQRVLKASAGIFDCTCRATSLATFKPAWNVTKAQFPTAEYQKKP